MQISAGSRHTATAGTAAPTMEIHPTGYDGGYGGAAASRRFADRCAAAARAQQIYDQRQRQRPQGQHAGLVAPMTTRDRGLDHHVRIDSAESGLARSSWVRIEDITTVSTVRFACRTSWLGSKRRGGRAIWLGIVGGVELVGSTRHDPLQSLCRVNDGGMVKMQWFDLDELGTQPARQHRPNGVMT